MEGPMLGTALAKLRWRPVVHRSMVRWTLRFASGRVPGRVASWVRVGACDTGRSRRPRFRDPVKVSDCPCCDARLLRDLRQRIWRGQISVRYIHPHGYPLGFRGREDTLEWVAHQHLEFARRPGGAKPTEGHSREPGVVRPDCDVSNASRDLIKNPVGARPRLH